MAKNLPAKQTGVRSLGREDPLEKEMATHSSTLAWKIPWTEELGGLQSVGSRRLGHDLGTKPQVCVVTLSHCLCEFGDVSPVWPQTHTGSQASFLVLIMLRFLRNTSCSSLALFISKMQFCV